MPTYTQADGPLAITTPLGKDVLLLTGVRGFETISQLFDFQLDLLAEVKSEVHFDDILGQNVTVTMGLPNGETRCFNGIVKRFSEGARDETFVHFRAEVVPKIWRLTKKVQSRIFQHLSVPDILHQVFAGLDVTYEILATYYQRDFCVQYRESDFDFASRLMEEEGIYYFFKHSDGSHQMVVTDVPTQHPAVPVQNNVIYEPASGAVREDMRIATWEKTQELRSGEYTLWDHCFELPGNHLEAKEKTVESVTVGEVTHKLKVGGNDQLEIYDYPGGYAQRFDGVDRNGEPRPQDLQSIFRDNQRTVRVRMEQEDAASLEIAGASDCGHFMAGHKFTMQRHFDGDGEYLLTRVEHDAQLEGDYSSYQELKFKYGNRFTCIPITLPYRPQRVTNRPVIAGIQTATVVGPAGEEMFCDKYGRVKVQFNWDREGKKDANSSCWLRVAQVWAGNGWGAFFWPRVGHEVVVIFEEGDPDQPVIIGSVYNAENMPWFSLPVNSQLGGFKSASVRGKAHKNFNGIVFNDEKGHEHLSLHSERNLSLNSESDKMIHSGRHKGERVGIANVLTVGKLIPGGGSGGGEFSEGDPWPHPAPQGALGMNAVVTYGDNFQVACPLNHQLAVGNNFQVCVNPFGLAVGVPGIPFPEFLGAFLGNGMGGNMQFTVGTSAQFTLGQSFEISIGPPKIEIHQGYFDHQAVNAMCGILAGIAIVYVIAYAVIPTYSPDPNAKTAVNQDKEQAGDRGRTITTLIYQGVVDLLLTAIMAVESALDNIEWKADDFMKQLFDVDRSVLQLHEGPTVPDGPDWVPPQWWKNWGATSFGCLGVLAAVEAEVLVPDIADAG
jgi:type VI secretion system secreted protein VgrG